MSDVNVPETVLVTGGAGYIGSWVTRFLLESGYEVRVLDQLRFGGESLSGALGHPRYEFMKGDIRDADDVEKSMKGVDRVVHLAALVGVAACDRNTDETKAINIGGTKRIVEEALRQNVHQVVFFSTCSSYGVQDTSVIADETQKLNPVSLYAETKIECERYLENTLTDEEMYYTVFRPSTVHGPSARMRFDLIVNHFTRDSYFDKEILIYGGEDWRPLIWVGDAALAVVQALNADQSTVQDEIFNLGFHGGNYRKIEIAEILKEQFVSDLEIEREGNKPDLRSYRVDFSKIENQLGFEHTKDLDEAISDIIRMIDLEVVDPYSETYQNA